jgi:glycosyltransferase involved in cell wall biosynthesis
MGTCHSFDSIVEAVSRVSDDSNLRFFFIGGGKQLPTLKEKLHWNNSVSFLPYQDRSELAHSLSAPDVHLICLNPKYDGLLVPSKLYGIMAAAKPTIFVGSPENEVARIISDAGCGIIVNPNEPEELVQAFRKLAADPRLAEEMGRRGRDYFDRNFERRIGTRRFGVMLEKVGVEKGVRGHRPLAHPAPALGSLDFHSLAADRGKR